MGFISPVHEHHQPKIAAGVKLERPSRKILAVDIHRDDHEIKKPSPPLAIYFPSPERSTQRGEPSPGRARRNPMLFGQLPTAEKLAERAKSTSKQTSREPTTSTRPEEQHQPKKRHMVWCLIFGVIVLLLIGFGLVIFWYRGRFKPPELAVRSVTVKDFLLGKNNKTVQGHWNAELELYNPNDYLSLNLEPMDGSLSSIYDDDGELATSRVDAAAAYSVEARTKHVYTVSLSRTLGSPSLAPSVYDPISLDMSLRKSVKFELRINATLHIKSGGYSKSLKLRACCPKLIVVFDNPAAGKTIADFPCKTC